MTQEEALLIMQEGSNVFLTGPAGSGKTFVLNQFIEFLQENQVDVAITASTGVAATHLNGVTIHSWAGIGIKDELSELDRLSLMKKPYLRERFLDVDILIIDEVSMLDGKRLDVINEVCQLFKQSIRPFGGMQVILCGDLFQLPPISKRDGSPDFVYKADVWKKMELEVCYLEHQFRQDDAMFLTLLNEIRSNQMSEASKQLLESRKVSGFEYDTIPTKLYTHNIDVDRINQEKLDSLSEKPKTFYMSMEGEEAVINKAVKGCLAPEELELKIGALVMFVKNNYGKGYVNGTLGTVDSFSEDGYPIVETFSGAYIEATPESWTIKEDGEVKSDIVQVPLRLAWAITVHKSQGMTLDTAEVDLSKCFEPGMGYVALSRLKSLSGLYLRGINEMAFQVNQEILLFDQELRSKT